MKKVYLLVMLVSAVFLGAFRCDAQIHLTSHMVFSNCDSQTFRIQTDSFTSSLRLITYFGDGHYRIDTFINGGTNTRCYTSHAYASSGSYTVKNVITVGGVRIDSVSYSDTVNICHILHYTSYVDNNGDCKLDSGDTYMPHSYSVEIDSAGVAVDTMSGPSFYYSTKPGAPNGTIYKFKMITSPSGYTVTCPTSGIKYDTIGTSNGYVTMGFGCDTSHFDLYIYAYMSAGKYGACSHVYVVNNSCTPKSATVTIHYSGKYSYGYTVPSTYSPTSSAGTLTYNVGTVSAGSPKYFTVHFSDTGTLTPGDTVHTTWIVTPTAGDADTTNNIRSRVDTIRSSFDPNEKSVEPQGNIHAGTALQYTIEFQNTGNATAQNIYVLDTLSDNLDVNSLQVLSSTSPQVTTLMTDGSGHNVVKFDLQNINLPDSAVSTNASSGEIVFAIKSKAGLSNGTKIDNEAGIYFDDNPVVVTNMVENMIGIPAAVSTMYAGPDVAIYPNPAHDAITVKTKAGDFDVLTVVNLMGQTVMQQHITNTLTNINLNNLPAGLYIISLKGSKGMSVQKFEKL